MTNKLLKSTKKLKPGLLLECPSDKCLVLITSLSKSRCTEYTMFFNESSIYSETDHRSMFFYTKEYKHYLI